jgi:hypothetical protein
MDHERGPVEVAGDVAGGAREILWFLFAFGIGIALVVMGNTLARLIGVALLAIGIFSAARWVRRRRAADELPGP